MEKEMETLNGEDVFSEHAEEASGGQAVRKSEEADGKSPGIYEMLEDEIMQFCVGQPHYLGYARTW